jgi:DDE superfamily endonuclease/Helix-turn-helix of DDE superfamily endonuclease
MFAGLPLLDPRINILSSSSSEENLSSGSSNDELCNVGNSPSPTKSTLKLDKQMLIEKNRALLKNTIVCKITIFNYINNPKKISFYTGFESYDVLYCFFEFFKEDASHMCYLGSTYKGGLEDNSDRTGRPRSLPLLEEFFMVLIRLRRGYEVVHLGDLFGLSHSQVSRICNSWILLMAGKLRQINFWPPDPPKEMLLVPPQMRDDLKYLAVIVDATEVYVQKPSATKAQKEIFSQYKNHVTAKMIVGVDANGVVIFYSKAYSGRTSDKKMFHHCGITQLLKRGDIVMVDRGFEVTKDLEKMGIKVLIPDFLGKKSQFTSEELRRSEKIAEVRVHVERAIRKIKEFKILSQGLFPLNMAPMMDSIWICCAVLSNFTGCGYLVKPKKASDVSSVTAAQ